MPFAEFDAKPQAVIIHDPVKNGSFNVIEEINDSGSLEEKVLFRSRPDTDLYSHQHKMFADLLRRHVEKVFYLEDLVGNHKTYEAAIKNPNQVFTRDSLITIPWIPDGYIKARMVKQLRRSESDIMEEAVRVLGLNEIIRIPEYLFLEGGDVIPFSRNGKRTLLIGHGPRSYFEAIEFLSSALIPQYADEIIAVELAPWRMNLDGGFVPVADDLIVAETGSILGSTLFNVHAQKAFDIFGMVKDMGIRIIDVTKEELVYSQACNCVCLGSRKIIYYDLSRRVYEKMQEHDIEVHLIPGSELVKGRGGPRCMTRPIYKN
jgi:N-dimethylarginine dimethylaminohydrolase